MTGRVGRRNQKPAMANSEICSGRFHRIVINSITWLINMRKQRPPAPSEYRGGQNFLTFSGRSYLPTNYGLEGFTLFAHFRLSCRIECSVGPRWISRKRGVQSGRLIYPAILTMATTAD